MYGTERRGAPVVAFCRIDDRRIRERDLVHEPDIVVVLDPLLGKTVDVTNGLKEGGLVLVNHPKTYMETGLAGDFKVATVDATKIALETLGRPITNTAILGAFAKATGLVELESLEKAIEAEFPDRIVGSNIQRDVADWRVFHPVIDKEKCVGCKRCWIYCPEIAISMIDGKADVNYDHCKGCGICSEECLVDAITLVKEEI